MESKSLVCVVRDANDRLARRLLEDYGLLTPTARVSREAGQMLDQARERRARLRPPRCAAGALHAS
jgi:hypothetical protein